MLGITIPFKNGRRGKRPWRSLASRSQQKATSLAGLRAGIFRLGLLLCLMAGMLPSAHAQLGFSPFAFSPLSLAAAPGRIVALVRDPRGDSTIFLASPGGGIWRSDDGGSRWSPQLDSSYSVQACSLAIDPSSPDIVYAGTGDDQSPRPAQGVARSADGGQSWNIGMRFTNQPVCSLSVDPANGKNVLAGSAEGLFLSRDSGTTWRKILAAPVTSIAYDGQGNVYAGELGQDSTGSRNNTLAQSSDGGQTWTNIPLPASPSAVSGVTNWVSILAAGPIVNLVVSYGAFQSANFLMDFYRSTDAGKTWTLSPSIGPSEPPVSLFVDSGANNLYVTGPSLLTSADQGLTWTAVTTRTSRFHAGVITGGSIMLGGEVVLEFVPLVSGVASREVALPLAQYLDVTLDSSGIPWAAGPGGLFGRFKAGIFGTAVGRVAAPNSGTSQNIFASANDSVQHSSNLGAKFTAATVLPSSELRAPYPPLIINPTTPANAYVAGRRLYRTTDSGTTWSLVATIDSNPSNVVTALAIAPLGGGNRTMYAASACLPEITLATCSTSSTIWQSTNTGLTWTRRSTVLGLVSALAVDSRQGNTVYAAVGAFPGGPSLSAGYLPGDLMRSTDGASTWISVVGNLPRVPINAIAIDPNSSPTVTNLPTGPGGFPILFPPGQNPLQQPAQTIYVGTDAGVFVTFNAGIQWTAINAGLPPVAVTQLSLQQPAGTLEAATFGRGAYQASVNAARPSLIANPLSVNLALNQGVSRAAAVSLANLSSQTIDWQLTPLDSWISVPASRGTLQPAGSTTATLQVSSNGLAIGTYLGRVQATTGSLVQYVYVTLQVTTPPASISIVSGNNASGAPGATLPPFVVSFQDATGAAVPGVQVNFQIMSGAGSLSPSNATSDAAGNARTTLTLPNTPGAVQLVASAGTLSVTFSATAIVTITPSLLANSVVNGITFNGGIPPSPGTILSIFGENLSSDSASAATLPLPTTLANTSVLLSSDSGDIPLPLFSVSPAQANALLPYDLPPGVYSLRVESNSVPSNEISLQVAAFSPGIFTMNSSGQGLGIFVKEDGSLVTVTNPAARGSHVSLYATGLGAVNPPVLAGAAGAGAEPFNRTVQTPKVFFDNIEATVQYSGLAPGFAGVYQLNVVVPPNLSPATNVSVSLSIGGITSNRVAIPVQ
jgi:uncharacterized protein (TIGR03437 family)